MDQTFRNYDGGLHHRFLDFFHMASHIGCIREIRRIADENMFILIHNYKGVRNVSFKRYRKIQTFVRHCGCRNDHVFFILVFESLAENIHMQCAEKTQSESLP